MYNFAQNGRTLSREYAASLIGDKLITYDDAI
jgi:hypothetical protein